MVAIQDTSFETVRDSIVQKLDSSIDNILTEIRQWEATLHFKDHALNTSGDLPLALVPLVVQSSLLLVVCCQAKQALAILLLKSGQFQSSWIHGELSLDPHFSSF